MSIRPRPARPEGEAAPAEPAREPVEVIEVATAPVAFLPVADPRPQDDRTTASPDGHVQRRRKRPRRRGRGMGGEEQGPENIAPVAPAPEADGNRISTSGEEPNGNVVDPEIADDTFGNR